MTTREEKNDGQKRTFVSQQEVIREPRPEEQDDEILAWMTCEIKADKATLDMLAEL